jgi:hypothetical protein
MKTNPWFSTEPEERASDIEVHHDNTSCKNGDNIPRNYRRYGTDNRPLCKNCARLDAAGR